MFVLQVTASDVQRVSALLPNIKDKKQFNLEVAAPLNTAFAQLAAYPNLRKTNVLINVNLFDSKDIDNAVKYADLLAAKNNCAIEVNNFVAAPGHDTVKYMSLIITKKDDIMGKVPVKTK